MKSLIAKALTKDYKQVPLFYVTFDLSKYEDKGSKGSCDVKLHPTLKDDQFVAERLKELIDYVRDNYNMDELSK